MLLRVDDWQRIREGFSADEKQMLNESIAGETICPPGCVLDEEKLPDGLIDKIKAALN